MPAVGHGQLMHGCWPAFLQVTQGQVPRARPVAGSHFTSPTTSNRNVNVYFERVAPIVVDR